MNASVTARKSRTALQNAVCNPDQAGKYACRDCDQRGKEWKVKQYEIDEATDDRDRQCRKDSAGEKDPGYLLDFFGINGIGNETHAGNDSRCRCNQRQAECIEDEHAERRDRIARLQVLRCQRDDTKACDGEKPRAGGDDRAMGGRRKLRRKRTARAQLLKLETYAGHGAISCWGRNRFGEPLHKPA